jgi:chloramphenicol 3-O phosphotransferase
MAYVWALREKYMTPGQIIFLNGTSSAGKGSIATALLGMLPAPYVHVGFDTFIAIERHPAYFGDEGFRLIDRGEDADERYAMQIGPLGARYFAWMHRSIANLAAIGHNVIVDEVLWSPTWLREYSALFDGYTALFVGVLCPLAVTEARERARGDRMIGLARSQFPYVHTHGAYDLTVDTSVMSATQCAEQIMAFLVSGTAPSAFREFHRRRAPPSPDAPDTID